MSEPITHAAMIPLVGGAVIGTSAAFQSKPEVMLSFPGFQDNDKHIREYFDDVPYYVIGEDNFTPKYVDVVSSVCPCAGLSSLSTTSNANSEVNDWMIKSSEYVLENIKPKVLFGENAPRLGSKGGRPVAKRLHELAKKYGYVFSIYRTQAKLHGVPQVRNRTFYFFWKGDKVPLFNLEHRVPRSLEGVITGSEFDLNDPMCEVVREGKPTDDPYYQYVLEVLHENKLSHPEFCASIPRSIDLLTYIEAHDAFSGYDDVSKWMDKNGYEKAARKCERMAAKLATGGNIMRRGLYIPKGVSGAFVGHLPSHTVHPKEDRFLTYRECLNIMTMPKDFILQDKKKCLNHICQNVPVLAAYDMAGQVKAFLDGNSVTYLENDFVIENGAKNDYEII